ncbi:MAG TPA: multiheme c-type cytochrome [Pyrinomonadaceae bacterium]|nr:multiheme c-type cytochrome [Pyrinomonadaceae bacterium]
MRTNLIELVSKALKGRRHNLIAVLLTLSFIEVAFAFASFMWASSLGGVSASYPTKKETARPRANGSAGSVLRTTHQGTERGAIKLEGCISCHGQIEPMHKYGTTGTLDKLKEGKDAVGLTCTTCHGGNPVPRKTSDDPKEIERVKNEAHARARFPNEWQRDGKSTGVNPERTNTLLARESWEFVRFINPGDLRVAAKTCGGSACHELESKNVARSMMTHGAMLWGAALYNNGSFPQKDARFGESYSETGASQSLIQNPQPTAEDRRTKGVLTLLDPIPRWEISQPGNVLRVFERGGKRRLEVGLPDKDEDPGKPDKGLSPRGFGSAQRTDPVFLGLQKTRLLDPTLNFLGTNDHPGDYRSSGCSACHVIYANDRDPLHSAFYNSAGNLGQSKTADANISKSESGHPIKHQFTSQIPTSQCMVCHMHPGTNMVATYLGMTWWDNESDGDKMYPQQQHDPSQSEEQERLNRNPEAASMRGLWSQLEFLAGTGTAEFNAQLKNTQFGDFHGHGWMFREVFKRDRKGNLLDSREQVISPDDPDKFKKAVHLNDIHLEKGMHCVDCHLRQDAHGDGNLYNEPRAAIEIGCEDCHGSIRTRASLFTSGPAAARVTGQAAERRKSQNQPLLGQDLTRLRVRDETGAKVPLFQRLTRDQERKRENGKPSKLKAGDIIQNSMVVPGRWWRVTQTIDTVTPGTRDYSPKSRYAKTVRKDNTNWGDVPKNENELAHRDSDITCVACHSSWVTSCFGCHLSMQANRKMPNRHNEGGESRNFTQYNFQVVRDDIFMLGRDGTVTGNRVAPVRSSSAVLVSSQNQNREWIYSQQQTTSAEGFSGQTFNTHVPHTVRARETKQCTDCHVSADNDNNAWLAQLLLQGTNFVNFMGRYVYVAAADALEVVVATEQSEPQAVIGSTLQKIAYPDDYAKFVAGGSELKTAYEHVGNPRVLQVQLRGEYAYVAAGEGGLRVYDVAQIDQKGFSERITTAPVSRFGQKFWVKTKYATAVAAPTTLAVDPARWRLKADGTMIDPAGAAALKGESRRQLLNEEQPIHASYAYLYVADKYEGLILVNAATLLDGDPLNNYLERELDPAKYPNGAFNPGGVLNDANNITIAGDYAYITTTNGLVVVSIADPLNPRLVKQIGAPELKHPHAIAIQFRYGFVVDDDGLKVLDVTLPESTKLISNALVSLREAQDVYVARTYAYVANGKEGVAIVAVEHPEKPRLDQMYDADGKLNDVHQVKIAMTNASLFAYVADGRNGLRVLQLTSPETVPEYAGFSPRPLPVLIATYKTKGEALAVSKPLDRDRAVDESGNQISVFGRRGARPFNFDEIMRMLRTNDGQGDWFTVSDTPLTQAKN